MFYSLFSWIVTCMEVYSIFQGSFEVVELLCYESVDNNIHIHWLKLSFFPIGYQAPYSGEWPSSLSPGQQNYSDHSSAVNHAQSITSQAMNNSFGPVPTNTSPKRSPSAHGHGKKKKQWMLLLFSQYWCCIVEQGSS